jgi:hypothetical protein
MEGKRFKVVSEPGYLAVWDNDFGYDASLTITGDWRTVDEAELYAYAICDVLNEAEIPKGK